MKDQSTGSQMSMQKISKSPRQTAEIAGKFSSNLIPGDLIAFYGQLGSGKTFFIKALCEALGIEQEATSPSFTIINEYVISGSTAVYHFDFYRIENEAELRNLGLDDFFYGENICLIEWADKIEKYLPSRRWNIRLSHVPDQPDSRKIIIQKIM